MLGNISKQGAVENLEELLNVPGLDGIVIGPHDLSVNMGLPEQYDHPDFENMVQEIIAKTRRKKLVAGIHFPAGPDRQVKWVKNGANIVLHSSDLFLFVQKLKEDLATIKKAFGESMNQSEDSDLVI